MLSHTPPAVHLNPYEAAHQTKRPRSGSISGRLRSASDLEERGIIDMHEKVVMKDLIISGDERLQSALDRFEAGDSSELEVLMHSGVLSRRSSMDLLEDLDLNFLHVGSGGGGGGGDSGASISGSLTGGDVGVDVLQELIGGGQAKSYDLNLDDLPFDASFESGCSSIGSNNSTADALRLGTPPSPSMLGRTPPDPFTGSFEELRMGSSRAHGSLSHGEVLLPRQGMDQIAGGGSSRGEFARVYHSSGPPPIHQEFSSGVPIPGAAHRDRTRQLSDLVDAGIHAERRQRYAGDRSKQQGSGQGHEQHAQQHPNLAHPHHGQHNARHRPRPHQPGAPVAPHAEEADTKHYIGAYSPDARRKRIQRFLEKRKKRVWTKKVKYDVRKNFADSRMRVKGRFVKKEDEELLRELMSIT